MQGGGGGSSYVGAGGSNTVHTQGYNTEDGYAIITLVSSTPHVATYPTTAPVLSVSPTYSPTTTYSPATTYIPTTAPSPVGTSWPVTICHLNYQNNEDVIWVIPAPSGTAAGVSLIYVVHFSSFSTESCCDPVSMWVTGAAAYTSQCTGSSCSDVSLVSSTGVTLKFHSDLSITYTGFVAVVSVLGGSTFPPSVSPSISPSQYRTTQVRGSAPMLLHLYFFILSHLQLCAFVFVDFLLPYPSFHYIVYVGRDQ